MKTDDGVWFNVRLSERQLRHIAMLCFFHASLSRNKCAIEGTRKLKRFLHAGKIRATRIFKDDEGLAK